MTDTPRIALILPVYNVAAFLPACLESLARQTLPAAELEIIAVDDGSTDASPAILADYAGRMPNLRLLRQENGGLSAARNTGMKHATGRWVAFVDSDDFVAPDTYASWLRHGEAGDLDMLLGNGYYHFEGRERDRPVYSAVQSTDVLSGPEWLRERLVARFLPHMACLHLYRREFIETNRFAFVPRLIHEDVIWTTRALARARRVRFDPEPRYFYRLPVRRFGPEEKARRLDAIIASSIYNARSLAAMIENEVADRELGRLIGWQLVDGALSIFHKIEQHPYPEARRGHYRRLRDEGLLGLLWRHACDARQKKKLASRWLRTRIRAFTA